MRPTARHLMREIDDILLQRPSLGNARRRRRGVPGVDGRGPAGAERRAAAQPGGAPVAALPADAPHPARDRRSTLRFPQHRPLAGQLDLPEVRRLVAKRCGASGPRRSVCSAGSRRVGGASPPAPSSRSWPSAIATFGAAATTWGSPTTREPPTSTSTISAARRPRSRRRRPARRRMAVRRRPRPARRAGRGRAVFGSRARRRRPPARSSTSSASLMARRRKRSM